MKKSLAFIPMVIGGAILGRRLLPAEWRQGISRLCGVMMGRMMAHMPDN